MQPTTSPEPSAEDARIASALEELKRDMEPTAEPALSEAELRARVDAIADMFLARAPGSEGLEGPAAPPLSEKLRSR